MRVLPARNAMLAGNRPFRHMRHLPIAIAAIATMAYGHHIVSLSEKTKSASTKPGAFINAQMRGHALTKSSPSHHPGD